MYTPSFFYLETPAWKSSAFFNFRLDGLIGLKINFNVRYRNVQNQLILLVVRLKNALCRISIDVSFEYTACKIVLKSETLCTLYT